MTEQDYIFATNLTKLRVAERTLRDVMPDGSMNEKLALRRAVDNITILVARYERKVEDAYI